MILLPLTRRSRPHQGTLTAEHTRDRRERTKLRNPLPTAPLFLNLGVFVSNYRWEIIVACRFITEDWPFPLVKRTNNKLPPRHGCIRGATRELAMPVLSSPFSPHAASSPSRLVLSVSHSSRRAAPHRRPAGAAVSHTMVTTTTLTLALLVTLSSHRYNG